MSFYYYLLLLSTDIHVPISLCVAYYSIGGNISPRRTTMNNKLKIAVIGGDVRQIYAAEYFTKLGHTASLFGFGEKNTDTSLEEALYHSSCVVLPVFMKDGTVPTLDGTYITGADIISKSKTVPAIFSGSGAHNYFTNCLRYPRYFDITRNKYFGIMNADITSEAALSIIICNTNVSLGELNAAILGYGKIGRSLSNKLSLLGCDPIVFARSSEKRAEASANGFRAFDLCDFDKHSRMLSCIVNTVPAKTVDITEDGVELLLLELASSPGGFSENEKASKRVKYINAQGLPGKTAPKSAGVITAKAVLEILEGEK